jgi:hypothetical protein
MKIKNIYHYQFWWNSMGNNHQNRLCVLNPYFLFAHHPMISNSMYGLQSLKKKIFLPTEVT